MGNRRGTSRGVRAHGVGGCRPSPPSPRPAWARPRHACRTTAVQDEPTSGLDSFTAHEVMEVVHSLATDGTTICATIHSPSSACFALFDRVMVLASGWTVYFGSPGGVGWGKRARVPGGVGTLA